MKKKLKLDKDIEFVLDQMIGNYLVILQENEEPEEDCLIPFIRGLKKLGEKLGVDIKDYDTDGNL